MRRRSVRQRFVVMAMAERHGGRPNLVGVETGNQRGEGESYVGRCAAPAPRSKARGSDAKLPSEVRIARIESLACALDIAIIHVGPRREERTPLGNNRFEAKQIAARDGVDVIVNSPAGSARFCGL
jgi:hypothetical protein